MAVLNLQISTARPTAELVTRYETVTGYEAVMERIINYISSINAGCESALSSSVPPSVAISIQDNMTSATGTLTCVSAVATNTVLINGVVFTAVASGATGNQFNVGSNSVTATNLAATINASASSLISGYVTASALSNVVTVTSSFYGTAGNQVTLSTTGGTITASVTRLVGGSNDATAQTLTF